MAKVRNYAVDFWRVIATVFVTCFHWWLIHPLGFVEGTGELTHTWFTTGNILSVFLIFTGYFMAASYEGKVRRGLTKDVPARSQAWLYMRSRYKGLYPAYILGLIWGFIVMNCIYDPQPLGQIVDNIFNSIWEITGLSALGVGATAATGIDYYPFVMYAWNTPLWYISAIFVGGYFLYYLLAKNKDTFVGFIAPLIVALSFGYWGLAGEGTTIFFTQQITCATKNYLAFGVIENSLLYGIAGMCVGVIIYYVVEWLKGFNYSEFAINALTVANTVLTALIIWLMVHGNPYDELVIFGIVTVTLTIVLLGKDKFTAFINRPIFGTLGKYSLYFFVAHFPMIYVMQTYLPMTNDNYYTMYALLIVLSGILGRIFQLISEKFLIPLLSGKYVKHQPVADQK